MTRVSAVLALAGAIVTSGLQAQTTIRIPDEAACPTCTLETQLISTIGRLDAPTSPQLSATAARDAAGNFWVAPVYSPYEVAVYSAEGDFLGTRGRQGSGPGEFRFVKNVHVGADGMIHVFERGNRYSRFTEGMERLVYTRQLPFQPDDLRALPDGSILVSHVPRYGERIKEAYHILGPDGRLQRSFGRFTPEQLEQFRSSEQAFRRITEPKNGRFWASWTTQYRLEQWDLDGNLVAVLERDASWYPNWTGQTPGRFPTERPDPRITATWQDDQNRLWVVSSVADRNWRPAARSTALHPDSLATVGISMRSYFDSVVEVIDLATMRVVTRERIDDLVYGAIGNENLIYVNRGTEWGDVVIDVLQLNLTTMGEEE